MPRPARSAALALCLLAPTSAFAHGAIPGMEGFYAGLMHPLTEPPQALALAALGLALGLWFPQHFPPALGGFVGAALAGATAALLGAIPNALDVPLLITACGTATLAALAPHGAPAVVVAASLFSGALIGAASAPDSGSSGAIVATLSGSFFSTSLALLYLASGVGWLRERTPWPWTLVGLRVLAAWIAAICVLFAALVISGAPKVAG